MAMRPEKLWKNIWNLTLIEDIHGGGTAGFSGGFKSISHLLRSKYGKE